MSAAERVQAYIGALERKLDLAPDAQVAIDGVFDDRAGVPRELLLADLRELAKEAKSDAAPS